MTSLRRSLAPVLPYKITNNLVFFKEKGHKVPFSFFTAFLNSDTILNLYTSPNTSVPFTITGFPGTQVQVIFTAPATTVALGPNRGATGTSTITASLTGATFTNGQSSVTVTDADVAYTLAIPAGGEVTGTAEFTYTGSVVAFTTIGVY